MNVPAEPGEELVGLAGNEPLKAIELAEVAVGSTRGRQRSLAQLALGLAHRNHGNVTKAIAILSEAIEDESGNADIVDRIEMSLAAAEAMNGDFASALMRMDRLVARAPDELIARAAHQRAGILQRSGDSAGAKVGYQDALQHFVRDGDDLGQGHLHGNLGILLAYEGDIHTALHEFALSRDAYLRADQAHWVARAIDNQGWATSCLGDLPRALELYDDAERRLNELGSPAVQLMTARAESLMRAGLNVRALAIIEESLDQLAELGLEADRAEALLLASSAALRTDDNARATELADLAFEALSEQGRGGWAGLARVARMEASGEALRDLDAQIAALATAGHTAAAVQVLIAQAEIAVAAHDLDDVDAALSLLPNVVVTPEEQFRLESVEAHVLAGRGQTAAALERCASTIGAVQAFMERTGSLELIGGNVGPLRKLVDLAKGMTINKPADFLRWADVRRSVATVHWPLSVDDETSQLLAAYRAVDQDVRQNPDDREGRVRLGELRAQLEGKALGDEVRNRVAATDSSTAAAVDVSVVDDKLVVHGLGDPGSAARVVDHAKSMLNALDRAHQLWMADPLPDNALAQRCQELALECESLVFGTGSFAAEVIVVDPELRHLPFGLLPRLASRDTQIALTRWGATPTTSRRGTKRVLVVDHSLAFGSSNEEVPDPERWVAPAGGVAEVLTALDGASVAHFRCHGGVEPDNPMFSWLGVGDQRLFLYDLTRLQRAPAVVVIAACSGARAHDLNQAAAASFAEGFLGAGAQWVIASPTVVADDDAIRRMLGDFHIYLESGSDPAAALGQAKRRAHANGDTAVASAFSCYRSSVASNP